MPHNTRQGKKISPAMEDAIKCLSIEHQAVLAAFRGKPKAYGARTLSALLDDPAGISSLIQSLINDGLLKTSRRHLATDSKSNVGFTTYRLTSPGLKISTALSASFVPHIPENPSTIADWKLWFCNAMPALKSRPDIQRRAAA